MNNQLFLAITGSLRSSGGGGLTVVQSVANTAGGYSHLSLTLTSVLAGDQLCVWFMGSNHPPTVSDDAGNTYTVSTPGTLAGKNRYVALATAAADAATLTISVTFSGAANKYGYALLLRGPTVSLDVTDTVAAHIYNPGNSYTTENITTSARALLLYDMAVTTAGSSPGQVCTIATPSTRNDMGGNHNNYADEIYGYKLYTAPLAAEPYSWADLVVASYYNNGLFIPLTY